MSARDRAARGLRPGLTPDATGWGRIARLGIQLFWLAIGSVVVGFVDEFVTRGLVPPLILLSLVAVWFVLRGDRAVDAPVAGD